MDWNKLNSSLTSAFLHLIHLPTIDHISLSFIVNFPLSSLTSSINLRRLDIYCLWHSDPHEKDRFYENVQTEMMPKIREYHTSPSWTTAILLHAKRQDGGPAFNFMDLRRVSMHLARFEEENVR